MFEAREVYDKNGYIPKSLIKKWNEMLIIKIFISSSIAYIVILEILSIENLDDHFHLASYNLVEVPMNHDGKILGVPYINAFDNGLVLMIIFTLGRIVFAYYALYIQWYIESEFSIFTELLLVSIVWFSLTFL